MLQVLRKVDLLLLPSPSLALVGLGFLWDSRGGTSSCLLDSSDRASSSFFVLNTFLWRSAEVERFTGNCFLRSTIVLVFFLEGKLVFLVLGLVSVGSESIMKY